VAGGESVARPLTYHQDRAASPAERMRALRARKRAGDETPKRYETGVTKPPAVMKPPTVTKPVTKRRALNGTNASGQEVVRKVLDRLKAPTDRKRVIKVIREIYPTGPEAALKAYDRALPRGHVRWISLARQWAGRKIDAAPEEAWRLVYDLITLAGPNRIERLGALLDSLERQWGGKNKFDQLREYRDRLRVDPLDWPKRRAQRGGSGATVEAILALMRADPKRFWTTSQLARKLRKSIKVIQHLTSDMRARGLIARADHGRGLLCLPAHGLEIRKSVSGRIIEKLIPVAEMRFSAVARAIEMEPSTISTPVATLRRIGVLEPADPNGPSDPRKRTPLRLSADARDKIARGQVIRDRRGFILWAPADAGQN
jgi:hypothetical protein